MEEARGEKLTAFISSIETLSSALDGFLGLVEEVEETYRQALQNGSKTDVEDALEDFMFVQYQYMRSKFDGLWFEDVNLERIVRSYIPSISVFGALDFELLIQSLLYVLQGKHYAITSASYDGGIDLGLRENFYFGDSAIGFATYYAQCKLYRGNVPVSHVRDFFGVITNEAAEGYFFTTGVISSSGRKFIGSANKSPYSNKLYFADKQNLKILFSMADEVIATTEKFVETDNTDEGKRTFDLLWEKVERIRADSKQVMSMKQTKNSQQKLFE